MARSAVVVGHGGRAGGRLVGVRVVSVAATWRSQRRRVAVMAGTEKRHGFGLSGTSLDFGSGTFHR